ncbi:MAG: PSD1 and planctomycete cytochrome C domain-containing protein [Planctomycetaceae bacterium]
MRLIPSISVRDVFVSIVLTYCVAAVGRCASGQDDAPLRFNRDVLPILADHCFACHGFDAGQRKAGLRLDRQADATRTLDSGTTAIVPGDSARSELWVRLNTTDDDLRMPPAETGVTVTPAQREILRRWIDQGAEYERHWALIRPRQMEPPPVPGSSHPIDRFVRARLQEEGITPSEPADRATLVRRVTLDLTGLPPSPSELDAFVADPQPDAYARVVERLLNSEHFGEHWARWWLDLAHYGDSDGYLQDFLRPVAWRYRQWVVDAFNRDLPFDQFTVQQLAGDLLPNATVTERMGTGFLRNTLSNREGGADLEEFRVKQVLDRTMTVGTTFLGLTIGCAQCHDHKFDAISQREYYQLYAFFNNADEVNFDAPLPDEAGPYADAKPEYDRKRAELLAPVAEPLAKLQADWEKKLLHTEANPGEDFAWERTLELLGLQWGQNLGEGQLEGLNIIRMPPERRTQDEQNRLLDYFLNAAPAEYSAKFAELNLNEIKAQLQALTAELPSVTRAPGMRTFPFQRSTHVFVRGDYRRHGEEVQPDTPASLPPLNVGRGADRLALARWLVSDDHPLTARVAVNRLWQELFGRGIVSTSGNFGIRGDRPSHPQLLDWLAVEFMKNGWSVKSILREIVTSQTYQQSSTARPEVDRRDPLNSLLARQVRLRLSGEGIRDSALAVSGLLSRKVGGPSVKPPQPDSVSMDGYSNSWEPSTGADRYRRGLYTFIQRTSPFAQFVTFDLPDTSLSCARRERSNTPLQALTLLNDPVFLEMARALANRVLTENPGNDQERLTHAFRLVVCRPPTAQEAERLRNYLQQQRTLFAEHPDAATELLQDAPAGTDAAWIALASVLLNLDEFIHRE